RVAGQRGELRGEGGQLVVMGRKERAAAIDLVEMLECRPGDREAVEGRRTAADLVEDDKSGRPGLVEDRRGLDHLDHKGRAAALRRAGGTHRFSTASPPGAEARARVAIAAAAAAISPRRVMTSPTRSS